MKPVETKTWSGENLAGWIVQENIGGVECFWNGKTLERCDGGALQVPAWFTDSFPKLALHGSLFIGNGRDAEAEAACGNSADENWFKIKFIVWDAPECAGDCLARLHAMQSAIAAHPIIVNAGHRVAQSVPHAHHLRECAAMRGATGIMVKHPRHGAKCPQCVRLDAPKKAKAAHG